MLDGMSDSIERSTIENLHSREVDHQSPTGLIFFKQTGGCDILYINKSHKKVTFHLFFPKSPMSGFLPNLFHDVDSWR